MIENNIIFAILLYLVATNNFCKLLINSTGIYILLKKTEYTKTPDGIAEEKSILIKTLINFKAYKNPF